MRVEIQQFITDVVLEWDSDECLPWPFYRNANGYGRFRSGGVKQIASRFICQLFWGSPPEPDSEAAHSCGRGHEGCVNPWHLSWKTPAENQQDRNVHGTSNNGERNGRVILTAEDVRCIRALKGTMLQKDMALMFGVSARTISHIMHYEIWKDLPDTPAKQG